MSFTKKYLFILSIFLSIYIYTVKLRHNHRVPKTVRSVSNEWLSKRRVLIKTGSQRSRRLLSVFTRVLRRVRLSILYVGQWRRKCTVDSISKPQLQKGFKETWKLCLNLCSRKWLTPSRSLVINLIPLGLWQLKRLLGDGLVKFRILFLKILKLLEFLMLWSSLFHL